MGSTLGVVHRMWSQEEKLKIVLLRLEQNISPKELSQRFGVNPSLLSVWCKQYVEHGADRLRSQNGIPRSEPTAKKKKEHKMNTNNSNPCMDNDVFNKMVGNWIYNHRKKSGHSQLELAKMVGLSQQHLAHVESGKRSIGLRGLMKMRCALNFSMVEFEAYIDNPGAEITVATPDDITDIQHLDIQLSDKALNMAIQEQQVYVLNTPWAVVGVCCFSIFQDEPYLNTFYVDQDYRKQGCDKELLTFWETTMKNQGYQSVLISTPSDNNDKYFYEKLGYQFVGSVQAQTRDSEVLMYRKYFQEQS